MGRSDDLPDDRTVPVRFSLERVRIVDGDYDHGGAYWGFGYGSAPIWRAIGDADHADMVAECFVRARSREEAKAAVVAKYPAAKFYR